MKAPVLESLFNKVAGLKRDPNTCFHVNIAQFSRTTILKNICERLLLESIGKTD